LLEQGPSITFAPYFDPTLNDEQKGNLVEVPTSSIITDKVEAYRLTKTFVSPQQ
jgi:hypothetical protein